MSDAARWDRIEALFDRAIDLDADGRIRLLDTECDDPALRAEVEKLLAAADASSHFLEAPPITEDIRLAAGTQVGEWRIGALLGRGGMGEVYEARRTGRDFEQRAALKLLVQLSTADARNRFAQERRILSRLQHPGIAHLIDGGEYERLPYVVMEFVQGRPLTEFAKHLPLQTRIDLFLQVCAAVSHAHRHLVVHRDLKPGNILVTADSRVKLLDFGIAKHLDAAEGSVTQVIQASPDYCAPEQLRGEPISAATDIYALGVILHELLTGQRLWQLSGLGLVQALDRLSQNEVPTPSSRVEGAARAPLRGDLDAIVLKALRPDPEQRYSSVEMLADDLRAWREHRPVQARGGALGYRVGRTLKRHRWWFLGGTTLFASLLLGLAGTTWQAREAAIERDAARREAERADAVRQYLMLMFRSASDQTGNASVTAKDVLDQAAARVHDEFATDPAEYADIVIALAELYFSLDDYTGARPLLERLLREGTVVPPEQRAMAQHDLAQMEFRNDQTAEAARLLAHAQTFWHTQPQVYRSELIMSRMLQSQLERVAGDPQRALQTLEEALPERIALSGSQHRETGKLVNNLGIAYFQLGRLDEAIAQFSQANQIWETLGLERSADALNTLNNWAAAEMRRQQPQAAIPIFREALTLRRELYPPSAATAALINNLGKTLTQIGRADEAVPLLREAVTMGAQYAGANSVLTVSATLGLADALGASGATAEAATQIDTLASTIKSTYGDAHILSVMLDLSRARLADALGDRPAALHALDAAEARLQALGAQGVPYLPQIDALRQQWSPADSAGDR